MEGKESTIGRSFGARGYGRWYESRIVAQRSLHREVRLQQQVVKIHSLRTCRSVYQSGAAYLLKKEA